MVARMICRSGIVAVHTLCWAQGGAVHGKTAPRSAAIALLGAAALVLAVVMPVEAQQMLRIVGAIQWVAGSRMQVLADGGASVAVDLTEADQASYQGLRNGDWVVVDGVWSSDRRRIVAYEIWRDSGRGYWTQSP
jgi:hypothetical protein